MQISVIIPTLNAALYLKPLVERLKSQSMPLLEIIVIDSASTDGSAVVARELGCSVIEISRLSFNHGGTRNQAAATAKGAILVFMTQDALPMNDQFLEELARPIISGEVAGAYARQIAYPDACPLEQFARAFNYPETSHFKSAANIAKLGIKAYFFSNVASAVRKDLFQSVGGFPDKIIINEDMVLCARLMRAKCTIGYVSQSIVMHSHNYRLSQQFARYFDMGVFVSRSGTEISNPKTGGEGIRFAREQQLFLFRAGYVLWVPRACAEVVFKFLGFQLGKHEKLLPLWLKKRFSMHSFFWNTNP